MTKKDRQIRKVVSKNPAKNSNQPSTFKGQLIAQAAFHKGPLPDPSTLSAYNQIIPNGADRILKQVESETAHRQSMEKKALDAEIDGLKKEAEDTKRGQYCGLIIGLAAIAAGAYTATNGAPWPGCFIGAGGVIGLVSAFIIGRKKAIPGNNGNKPSKEIVSTKEE